MTEYKRTIINVQTKEIKEELLTAEEVALAQELLNKDPEPEIPRLKQGHQLPADATYLERRAVSYPSFDEQLDMQYWDAVNGTTTWADAIAAVKAEYPKP